jgi:hypothetical protein
LLLLAAFPACNDGRGAHPVDGGADGRLDLPADVVAEAPRDLAPVDAAEIADVVPRAGGRATWLMPDPAAGAGPTKIRYRIEGDVVRDEVTGLSWQRASAPGLHEWPAADGYCAGLALGGFDDWRLPTRIELVSLVDYTRHTPTIDPSAFPGTPSEWFWSASKLADLDGFAWYVYFETGFSNFVDETYEYRVRCVRGGGASWPGYLVSAETVADPATGLEWQRLVDDAESTQAEAMATCAARPGGWRLPTMKELQTLVDDSRAEPAIDVSAFPDTPSESFWTATPFAPIPGSAWRTSFQRGYTYDSMKESTYRTRCVRSLPR